MQHIAPKVTNRRGRSLAAFLAAAMLAVPAAIAVDYSEWKYEDDHSANRTPAIGTSSTWENLFHWEVFTAKAQCSVNHTPFTVLIMK